MTSANRIFTARGIFGLVLITIGAMALFGFYYPHFRWEDYWPLGFVVWGLARFANQGARGWFFSGILVLLGAYLTLEFTEPYFYWRLQRIVDWDMIWPLALVGAGAYIIVRNMNRGKVSSATVVGEKSETDTLSVLAILGGNTTKVSSKQFRGGSATAVLGGAEIDLRDSKIVDGADTVIIDANAVLGGIEIFAPSDWAVKIKGTPLLGSIEDQRGSKPAVETASKNLVIDGLAIMGSIEIKG